MILNRRKILWCVALVSLLLSFGCAEPRKSTTKTKPTAEANGLGDTVGMLTEVFASDAIPVRGYALVGGLNGTGSSECPAQVRTYLDKYILQHLGGTKVNVNELISSTDTAVVVVEGIIPPAASKDQRFDVMIAALPSTQTTSLESGWLYGADLYEARQFGMSKKSIATAQGPVYTDSVGQNQADKRTGYVLGGGTVLEDYKISLVLRRPDYRAASQIRNRINGRFGYETALALTPGNIELHIPTKYVAAKNRFIQLVRAIYLADTPQLTEKRIITHIQKLAGAPNKNTSEIALEAIGNAALPKLADLLNSSDPEVRLRAARCMLNLGDQRGREVLWNIASDKTSAYRVEAIETFVNVAAKDDASPMLRGLLRDDNFFVRLAAYENLVRLNDTAVSVKLISNSFYLDQIAQSGKPAIFVSRQNQPRVALFSTPIYCRSNLFIETPDGAITINIPAEEQMATIIRKHPRHPDVIIQLKSSNDLADIIQTLCREPLSPSDQGGPGLGVSYSTLAGLLKQMADSGAVPAEFHIGPQSKTLPTIKK